MIDETGLLDPTSAGELSNREKEVIEDAQNAGASSDSTGSPTGRTENPRGAAGQTVDPETLKNIGKPGGESDISGGVANLDETTEAAVEQNEYNR